MAHGERYRRAREFFDVVTGLWDSFADDAFLRDLESGIFFDPAARCTCWGTRGRSSRSAARSTSPGPCRAAPVIVQAASSGGRQIAAETAEAVFGAASTIEDAKRYYADVKGRMRAIGRNPDT
jgi:alkanesulfonate monooxygenase